MSAPSARLFRYSNCAFTRISNSSSLSRNSWGSLVIFRRLLRGVAIAPRVFIGPLLSPPVPRSRIARRGIRINPDSRRRRDILSGCGTYQRQVRRQGRKKRKFFHGLLSVAATFANPLWGSVFISLIAAPDHYLAFLLALAPCCPKNSGYSATIIWLDFHCDSGGRVPCLNV